MYLYADYGMNWFSAYNWCKKEGEYQGRPLRLPTKEEALSIDMQNRISSLWDSYNAIWTSTDANGLGENVNGCSKYTIDTGGSVGTAGSMDSKRVLCVSENYTPRVCPSGSVPYENQCENGVASTVASNLSNAPCYVCSKIYGCPGGCPSGQYCKVTDYSINGDCNSTNANYWTVNSGQCTALGTVRSRSINGTGMVYYSNTRFTWWDASNWCEAQGKRLLTYDEASSNLNNLYSLWAGTYWYAWTSTSSPANLGNGSCAAYVAQLYYMRMDDGKRSNGDYMYFALCVDK